MKNPIRFLSGILFCVLLYTNLQAEVSKQHISVGIFPRHNFAETFGMFTPIAKYLSQNMGVEVKIETAKTFTAFWSNVQKNKYDLVHLNQYQYLSAHKDSGYQILLMNEEFNAATLRSYILVRSDSGINNLSELKGKNIIFGGNNTAMMSYLIPRHMLLEAGLQTADYTTTFARNPPNALMGVILKRADACGVGDAVLKLSEIKKQINTGDINIIAKSEPVPHLAWATSPKLAKDTRSKLEMLMLQLNKTAEGKSILKRARITALHKATHADYAPLEKYIIKEQ